MQIGFKSLLCSFVVTAALGSSVVWAQDAGPAASVVISTISIPSTQPGEQPMGAVISPMKKGQKAPYTGVLFSPVSVANVMTLYGSLPQMIQIEVDRKAATEKALCEKMIADNKAGTDYSASVEAARLKIVATENERLRKIVNEIESKNNSRWSSYTWAGIGAVGGVGLTLGVVWLVSQATK